MNEKEISLYEAIKECNLSNEPYITHLKELLKEIEKLKEREEE